MLRNSGYAYGLLTVAALWLSYTVLPILLFVAFVPVFWYFRYGDSSITTKLIAVGITLALSYSIISTQWGDSLWSGAFYGLLISTSFGMYAFSDRIIPNRLGIITLLLFICSMEYLAIRWSPSFASLLLGSALDGTPAIHRWSESLGIIGVSSWIIAANIWVTQIFSPQRTTSIGGKLILLIYPVVIISLPGIISYFWMTEGDVPNAQLLQESLQVGLADTIPLEKLGRTCAWVSVFVLVYAFVQLRIKKK